MIEKILQKWISRVGGLPTVQEKFNGQRIDTDHISWNIVDIDTLAYEKKKQRVGDVITLGVVSTSILTLSVNCYGYQGHRTLLRLASSKYETQSRNDWEGCLAMRGEPTIKNTSYKHDAENEPRWTGTYEFHYTYSDEFEHDIINKWILNPCYYVGDFMHLDGIPSLDSFVSSNGTVSNNRHINRDANFNVKKLNTHYLIDSRVTPVTATVSAPPQIGATMIFTDAFANSAFNGITIDFGNQLLYGETGSYALNCDGATVWFEFVGGSVGWVKLG